MQNITDVAVAVIQHPNGQVLLAQRPPDKPWAGWWEFPGGKIENGETVEHALQRELQEELNIVITQVYPWMTRQFEYPEKTVRLHFFRVLAWQGEPSGCEGQILSWQYPAEINVSPLLPANQAIIAALNLPSVYAISHVAELGELEFLKKLERALTQGLRLIQLREKSLTDRVLLRLGQQVIKMAHTVGAKVLLNGDIALAEAMGADGMHLPAHALLALQEKPDGMLVAASCHNAIELAHAEKLNLDFVVLSPVLPTMSHPEALTLGWQRFSALANLYSLPIFALGGMQPGMLETAWKQHAHGIALQRAIWR